MEHMSLPELQDYLPFYPVQWSHLFCGFLFDFLIDSFANHIALYKKSSLHYINSLSMPFQLLFFGHIFLMDGFLNLVQLLMCLK